MIQITANCDNPQCHSVPVRTAEPEWPSSFVVIELVTKWGTKHPAGARFGFCGSRCISEWAANL
jgi:hypothetical protein